MKILTQRIYDKKQQKGYRVLVDRLWPRGISKEKAAFDVWNKDIAPSTELRQWFHQKKGSWPEFRRKYMAELKRNKSAVEALLTEALKKKSPLILLYGTKDKEHNHAQILKDYLIMLMEEEERPEHASPVCFSHVFD